MTEGQHRLEGFDVLIREIPHKGGRTFGFRVSDGAGSLAYLGDHFPLGEGAGPDGLGAYHEAALALARDVDVLVHDAQFLAAQFPGSPTSDTQRSSTPSGSPCARAPSR